MIERKKGQIPLTPQAIFEPQRTLAMSIGSKFESFDPAKSFGSLFEEFKNFAFKGNMVDLAIGVIIGAAFGAIVTSLVNNIIMPLVSLAIPGNISYENLKWVLASHMKGDKWLWIKPSTLANSLPTC